tara:strand:+ start:101 stop:295 length:195 start_codon:yes stop_codon:yes gene_type:complete
MTVKGFISELRNEYINGIACVGANECALFNLERVHTPISEQQKGYGHSIYVLVGYAPFAFTSFT